MLSWQATLCHIFVPVPRSTITVKKLVSESHGCKSTYVFTQSTLIWPGNASTPFTDYRLVEHVWRNCVLRGFFAPSTEIIDVLRLRMMIVLWNFSKRKKTHPSTKDVLYHLISSCDISNLRPYFQNHISVVWKGKEKLNRKWIHVGQEPIDPNIYHLWLQRNYPVKKEGGTKIIRPGPTRRAGLAAVSLCDFVFLWSNGKRFSTSDKMSRLPRKVQNTLLFEVLQDCSSDVSWSRISSI